MLGERHLETFNADNLFEKIDGRAESFLQYDVKGMAYANLHPTADESNELQVYIFEMSDGLEALRKVRIREGGRRETRWRSDRKVYRRREHPLLLRPLLHPDRVDDRRPRSSRRSRSSWPSGSPRNRSRSAGAPSPSGTVEGQIDT